MHIESWLSPQASEILRYPTTAGAINLNFSLASPLNNLDIPIGQSLLMSEDSDFVLSFDYYNADGEKLNISDGEYNK